MEYVLTHVMTQPQGLGICAIAGNAWVANPYPLTLTTQLVVCLCFLLVSVIFAVSFMIYSDFRAGSTLGILEYHVSGWGGSCACKA